MKVRFGALTTSVLALGLALAAFASQAPSAEPLAVEAFGPPPSDAAIAAFEGGVAQELDMFHPAAAADHAGACAGADGVTLLAIGEGVSLLCQSGQVAGVVVVGGDANPQLIKLDRPKKNCPKARDARGHLPAA